MYAYEIEPAVWDRVGPDLRIASPGRLGRPGDIACLLRHPNVGAGIRLERRITLSSDIM